MNYRCIARTGKGYQCLNRAKEGPYCPGHDPDNWCTASRKNGGVCRRMKRGDDWCALHQTR